MALLHRFELGPDLLRQKAAGHHPAICPYVHIGKGTHLGNQSGTMTLARTLRAQPDAEGHFGYFGGQYVAETFMPLILALERDYRAAQADIDFHPELNGLLKHFIEGRLVSNRSRLKDELKCAFQSVAKSGGV